MSDRQYPAWVHHPAFQPAVVSPAGSGVHAVPIKFSPVLVTDEDMEAQYVAKGYDPVEKIDPRIFEPKAPDAVPYVRQEYPQWVGDVLVQHKEEHRARFPNDFPEADKTDLGG